MQVDAVYENGVVTFQSPLRLKHKRVQVQVVIPDESFAHESRSPGDLRNAITDILGVYARQRQSEAVEQDKNTWHEHLERKYGK